MVDLVFFLTYYQIIVINIIKNIFQVVITPKPPHKRSSKRKSPPKYHFTSQQKCIKEISGHTNFVPTKIGKYPVCIITSSKYSILSMSLKTLERLWLKSQFQFTVFWKSL